MKRLEICNFLPTIANTSLALCTITHFAAIINKKSQEKINQFFTNINNS